MLIDNKKDRYDDGLNIVTVWDFIKTYAAIPLQQGKFDIVTGYFTLRALSKLYHEIPENVEYRLLSSELLKDENDDKHIIDLLRGDEGINATFNLDEYVRDAKAFLMRDSVSCRAVTNAFCHAKVYLYEPKNKLLKGFFLSGSSNLTDSGLGLRHSSNIELTMGKTADRSDADYRELTTWFDEIWAAASETLPTDRTKPKSERLSVKEYFIQQIDNFFRDYSPEEIYYKILFELFNADLELDASIEHRQDMSLLQTSTIWKTLFNYQQKGVISLIKMLRKYNGAILADAVGLGKTFSALAVIKYFQTQNYITVLLCPKKLELNWTQYLRRGDSRFEADEFDYIVRFHSDFQNDRLQNRYDNAKLSWLQSRKKVLIVIDESHNLRNEKSSRYKELLSKLVQNQPGQQNRDVKVLMLSATPINTGLNDVKGQFNLIARGIDSAFNTDDFGVESLRNLFADAQRKYTQWCDIPDRTIGGFIKSLPPKFFNLTDRLIVARTRKLIEKTLGEDLGFPNKEKPTNIYHGVDHFGSFQSTEEIYAAFDDLSLSAYQPSRFMTTTYTKADKDAAAYWNNDVNRERFLVKMMGMLFMKRLESSWFSCKSTVKNVLDIHESTLAKVVSFLENQKDETLTPPSVSDDEEDGGIDDECYTLRKGDIKLSEMRNIRGFKNHLEADIKKLRDIYSGLEDFAEKYQSHKEHDVKLDELERILRDKQRMPNKKVVIFTVYADTAKFIYDELRKRGFSNIAAVSGTSVYSTGTQSRNGYFSILQRFAPYSKLYKELDWRDLYETASLSRETYYNAEKQQWDVPYNIWRELASVSANYAHIAPLLNDPIDILIATDCLSEGQNLQDADMQINYDIHWNPVRLIQRFGRIDRIGSPNKSVCCVNFWPAKTFEDYLHLESRVTNRMAAMNLVGSETQELNDAYKKIVEDNPLQDRNADRLLKELQHNSISDIESPRTLSLKDFSFEVYRQDLIDYFERNKEVFRRMPNGIFSGFSFHRNLFEDMGESLIGVIGYPHRDEGSHKPYREIYLMCQPTDPSKHGVYRELNKAEILEFLRQNKKADRSVPQWIDSGDSNRLSRLSAIMRDWMKIQIPKEANAGAVALLKSNKLTIKHKPKQSAELLEDKFRLENFDLIVWEYITVKE